MANGHTLEGRPEKALDLLHHALATNPVHVQALEEPMVLVQTALGNLKEAQLYGARANDAVPLREAQRAQEIFQPRSSSGVRRD